MSELALKHGLSFAELYDRDGLIRLDRAFVVHLADADVPLHDRLMSARADVAALDKKAESELIVELAPHLEDFLGQLFGIEAELRDMQARHDALAPLYATKRLFVQRRAVKEIKEDAAAALDGDALRGALEPFLGSAIVMPTRSPVGSTTRRRTLPLCASRSITPAGRYCRPAARRRIAAACCSRCRTGSTCSISCRSRPLNATA
jgi:hypothetical protein